MTGKQRQLRKVEILHNLSTTFKNTINASVLCVHIWYLRNSLAIKFYLFFISNKWTLLNMLAIGILDSNKLRAVLAEANNFYMVVSKNSRSPSLWAGRRVISLRYKVNDTQVTLIKNNGCSRTKECSAHGAMNRKTSKRGYWPCFVFVMPLWDLNEVSWTVQMSSSDLLSVTNGNVIWEIATLRE